MKDHCENIIIGAGASGIAAAITLKKLGKECLLLERSDRIGKKIALAGNGRCNLLNGNILADKYNAPDFFTTRLPVYAELKEFFEELGLAMRSVGDLIYPYSFSSSSVVDVLRFALEREGVTTLTSTEVTDIKKADGSFTVIANGVNYSCKNVIFACGSSVRPGVDSMGLLRGLGLKVKPFLPALTSFSSSSPLLKGLSGVRVNAVLTLKKGNDVIAKSEGEILFKDKELSGIAAFDLSRSYDDGAKYSVVIDLFPDIDESELTSKLIGRIALGFDKKENAYVGLLHKELFANVFKSLGADTLTPENAGVFAERFKNYQIGVDGLVRDKAQIMRGGLDLTEMRDGYRTRIDGLYVTGEALDVDGACGGYNLSHAWWSGITAAKQIGEKS